MATNSSIVHTFRRNLRSSTTLSSTKRRRKKIRQRTTTGKQKHLFPSSFIFLGLVFVICFCCGGWTEQVQVSAQFAELFDAIGVVNDAMTKNNTTANANANITNITNITDTNTTIIDTNTNTTITQPPIVESGGDIVQRPSNAVAADSILYPWFIQLLGCCSLFVLTRFNCPIPYAAIMFIWGAIFGIIASTNEEDAIYQDPNRNYIQDSITAWINIDSATLLLVFLPGLIFKDAVEIPINLFQVAIVQIWILSFPMVLVGTAITGVVAMYCLPYESDDPDVYGIWSWLTLGAILASTDPIAVSSVLKTAGASPRLVMHISGESLLNDGSSYVFFTIAANKWYQDLGLTPNVTYDTAWEWTGYFFQMSLGGSLMGMVFGFGLLGVLWELDRRMEKDFDIVQVVMGLTAAYLCYYVCDQMLTMSGVVATVALGVVVNRFGRGMINDEGLMSSYLALADFLLNTLLFALGGTIWGAASFSEYRSARITSTDIGWLLVFYILCFVIRFIQVGLFYPIISRIGLKSNWKEGVFLAYGGLHGSVGVALGLSLLQYVFQNSSEEDTDKRKAATIIQFLGGGATLLTLTINGTSAGFILKQLGLVKPKVSGDHTKHLFEGTAKDFVYNQIVNLLREPRFRHISFPVLKELVPFVTKQPRRRTNYSFDANAHTGEAVENFNQCIIGGGQQYMNLLQATRRASDHISETAEIEYKHQLLIEMRQIFLELLREAYKFSIEVGELDAKNHGGFLSDVLMQSVDLALNDVRYDDLPIDDWKHTEIFFRWDRLTREYSGSINMTANQGQHSGSIRMNSNRGPINSGIGSSNLHKRKSSRKVSLESAEKKNDIHANRVSNISFTSSLLSIISAENSNTERKAETTKLSAKRIRVDVLRAIAFKHGHSMAEAKLQLYVSRFYDEDNQSMRERHQLSQSTLETVLSESRDQVTFADEMLEKEVDDRDLHIILSHYCAKILIRRLRKFTEQKAADGLIGKQEARTYLRGMKDKINEIEAIMVQRLAESASEHGTNSRPVSDLRSVRVREDDSDNASQSRAVSDLGSIRENDNGQNTSRLKRLFESDASIDPENADTIGASNAKSNGKILSSTPLTELFRTPSRISEELAMPEIEKCEDEIAEKKKDHGDETRIGNHNETSNGDGDVDVDVPNW